MAGTPPRLPSATGAAQRNRPAPHCDVGIGLRQPDLFEQAERAAEWDRLVDPARARRADPATSHEAAARVREFDGEHYRLILEALREPGHIYALAVRTGLTHVQVARRTAELALAGKIQVDGEQPGPTGRKCRVWRLAP